MMTANEMMDEIRMMEDSHAKLLKTAEDLKSVYGDSVKNETKTLEDLADNLSELIDQGYDLYHDALTSGEGIVADSFSDIKEDLEFIMSITDAIAKRKYSC